jgi:hypothetical protein
MPPMPGRKRRGRPPHDDVLTPTEWRVVHAVQHGMSNREKPGPESILYLRVDDIRSAIMAQVKA